MVTAAHNTCIRELLQEVNMHGKADRHMRLLTIEAKSMLGTLWDQDKEEEMKIPWKEANEGPPVPGEQYQERFWRRIIKVPGEEEEEEEDFSSLMIQ